MFSGCEQLWMIPFMSRYRQSNSPLGFGSAVLGLITRPFDENAFGNVVGRASWAVTRILGYFLANHLKKEGTPMVPDWCTCEQKSPGWFESPRRDVWKRPLNLWVCQELGLESRKTKCLFSSIYRFSGQVDWYLWQIFSFHLLEFTV